MKFGKLIKEWIGYQRGHGYLKSAQSERPRPRALRTDFQRYLWIGAFVIGYFVFMNYYFSSDDSGSVDNTGVFYLIIGALFVGAVGAVLAPRLTKLFLDQTPQGRRMRVEKKGSHKRVDANSTSVENAEIAKSVNDEAG